MLNDPTIKLWFGHTQVYKELAAEKESESLIKAIDEIIAEEQL